MKIRLNDLKEKAKNRPEGYLDDVLSRGTLEGDVFTIETPAYQALVEKYNPTALNPPVQSAGCCGGKASPSAPLKRLQMPSVGVQMQNAAGAVGRTLKAAVMGERVKAPEDVIKSRQDICAGCEFLDKEKNKCSKCGCYYKVKITLAQEKCPIDKWAAVP